MTQNVVNKALRRTKKTDAYLSEFRCPPARFEVGDLIKFEKRNGDHHYVFILGIEEDGEVDAAFWDGLPNFFKTNLDEISALRILKTERLSMDDVAMYRSMGAAV